MSSSYASDDEEMEEESPAAVKKMKHLSNEGLAQELFNRQLADGPGPLGLNLTKSPSFMELIQREMAKAARAKGKQAAESSGTRGRKLTTCHFEGSLLRIGDWQWKSMFKGELVAKFYFAKNKIVWEMIHEGLKNKIEIKFFHISALKVTRPNGLPGTLEITVSREPNFYRETTPRPRRCTTWTPTADFTDGQAGAHRHVLYCEPGIMDRHVENLLKDQHLYSLSQEHTNNLESPPLEQLYPATQVLNSWAQQNSYPTADGYQFGTEQIAQPSSAAEHIPTGTTTGVLNLNGNHYGGSSLSAILPSSVEPSWASDQSNSNMFSWDNYFQTASATTAQPFTSNGGNTSGNMNHINNQMSSGSSHRGLDVSSSSVALPDVIRRNPDDGPPIQPVAPVNHAISADHGVLFPSSVPVTVNTAATQVQLTRDMFDWKNLLQTPPQMNSQQPVSNANAGIMNNTGTGNLVSNQINPWSFQSSSVGQSSSRMVLPGDNSMNNNYQQVNPWSFPSSGIGQSSSRMALPDNNQQIYPWSYPSSGVGESSSRMALPNGNNANNNHQQINPGSLHSSGAGESSSMMALHEDNSRSNNQKQKQVDEPWPESLDDILFTDDDFNGGSSSQSFLPDVDPAAYDRMYRELIDEEAVAVAVAAAPAVPAGEEAVAVDAAPAVPAEEEALASAPNSLPRLNGQPAAPSATSSSQSSSSLQANNNAAQDAAPPTQVTDAAGFGSRSEGDGDDDDDIDAWLAPLID